MRRLSIPLALIVGLLVSGAASAAGTTAFTGEWIGNDPAPPSGDGSVVHLYITGGTQAKLTLTDELGSVCINAGSSDPFFTSTITGEVAGDYLFGTFHSARCGTVPLLFLRGEGYLLVLDDQGNDDPSDDTLDDGSVTWHRA
jgi:hypothetical protein